MSNQPSTQIPFSDLPEGTVTFLFTDIEGSTQLLHRLRDKYAILLEDHHRILREAFANWDGHEVDTQGDAFFVAFSRATQAVGAAAEAQRKLNEHIWPERVDLRVRMGIHTGESWTGSEGYVGMDVHRAARIAHVGNGGQVLLSETTTALVQDELPQGVSLLDLGRHLLKDLHRPERIHQLVIEDLPSEFPALTSLEMLPPESARPPRKVGACPYRGLSAFQEADAQFYFGRETFVDALERSIHTKKLVAVIVGSSGSGKSSVMLAGLLPRLRKAGGFQFAIFRPGSQPYYAMAGALLPLLESNLSEIDYLVETRKLAEKLVSGEVSLTQVAGRVLEKTTDARQILLVVDQFEELYTLCPDEKLQKSFIDELLATVQATRAQHAVSVVILLTLRADFMGQALVHRPFADALQEASLLMGPMNRQELHTAIQKPAEMQGAAFEPGLVERILDDVGEKPGNLPLLEFTLTQLWVHQTDGWLTHNDYEAMGCVEGALASYADQVYADLDEDEQELARHSLVQLVQPGEGTEDTRRIATRQEFGDDSWQLIQHLADKRLVVAGRNAQGHETAEVVHEALIQKWGRFQEWMNADRTFRTWQEGLRSNLHQWQESGQETGALLSGGRLSMAREWLVERGEDLSRVETEYIIASQAQQRAMQEAETAREKREVALTHRARNFLSALVAILLLAVIGTSGLAYLARQAQGEAERQNLARATQQYLAEQEAAGRGTQQAIAEAEKANAQAEASMRATAEGYALSQADLATARELSLAALNNLEIDPERSILLGLQSADIFKSLGQNIPYDLQSMLHRALLASRVRSTWSVEGNRILLAGFNQPDDHPRALTLNNETGLVTFWDLTSNQKLLEIQNSLKNGDLINGSFSPDSSFVALAINNKFSIWDVGTGQMMKSIIDNPSKIQGIRFSPDNQLLIYRDIFKYFLLEIESGNVRMEFRVPDVVSKVAVFSADGKLLAVRNEAYTISIFNTLSGDPISTIQLERDFDTSTLTFNPEGTRLSGASTATKSIIWDVKTGEELYSFDISHEVSSAIGQIEANAYSPDGTRLALPGVIYDADNGKALFLLPGHTEEVTSLSFNSDGTRLITASNDNTVKIWDMGVSSEVLTLSHPEGGKIYGVAFSPDGKLLVTAGEDMTARVWELATGELIQTLKGHLDVVYSVAFSPDGALLATGSADRTVRIWDVQTWNMLRVLSGHHLDSPGVDPLVRGVVRVEFSPLCDGSADSSQPCELASAGTDSQVIIWDAKTGRKIFYYEDVRDRGIRSVAYSPDGKLMAFSTNAIFTAPGGEVFLYNAQKKNNMRYIKNFGGDPGVISDLDFSPDSTHLAYIHLSGFFTTFNLSGFVTQDVDIHGLQSGNALVYDPSNSYLVTAGSGTITFWGAHNGEFLFSLAGHESVPNFSLAFSPDGKYLASTSFDGTARVYVIPPDDLIAFAQSRLTRGFTLEECQQYLHVDECPISNP
jgi:WD40 repeat protein/class 3 adenylate cyclase